MVRSLSMQEMEALEAKQSAKMEAGGSSSKFTELLKKHNYDVYVIQNKVSVRKGATFGATGKNASPAVTVLNKTLDEINLLAEHGFYYPNKEKNEKFRFEPCFDFGAEDPNCPICKAARQKLHGAKNPYSRMALTVLFDRLDDNGTLVGYDKKLLIVKGEHKTNFMRILQAAAAQNGGIIRGTRFHLERSTEEKSPSSGRPYLPVDGSAAFTIQPESFLQQIQAAYQPTEVRSQDGKYVTKPVNWLTTSIDINNNLDILGYSSEEELKKEFDPSYVHNVNLITPVAAPVIASPQASVATPVPVVAPVPVAATVPQVVNSANVSTNGVPMTGTIATEMDGNQVPLASAALPPVPVAVPPAAVAPVPEEVPAIAQQRNLTPVAPSVQNGQQAEASETPWDE